MVSKFDLSKNIKIFLFVIDSSADAAVELVETTTS